ncbi:uncharacterized protein O3C94_001760 [Discoglossus pictus]
MIAAPTQEGLPVIPNAPLVNTSLYPVLTANGTMYTPYSMFPVVPLPDNTSPWVAPQTRTPETYVTTPPLYQRQSNMDVSSDSSLLFTPAGRHKNDNVKEEDEIKVGESAKEWRSKTLGSGTSQRRGRSVNPPHDFLQQGEMETSHLANVKELALTDPDITLYVDGSRYADENGKYHTGYAVTTEKDVIRAFSLPPSMSAQEAELIALTKACEIAAGRRANIYTDSRYALGVTQDFGIIWKARGFMTAAGTPVKHDKAIRELMDALALPKEVAILKVKAHGKLNSNEARGNHLADQTAKKAAMISQEMDKKEEKKDINIYTMQTLPTDLKLLKELQKNANPEEVNKWKAKGAILKDGLYVDNLRLCLPKNLYPATVQWAHGPAHLSKTLMNALIDKYYMAPGITTLTSNYCKSCSICAKCNTGRTEKPPQKHLAKSLYPFQRIQIDHIQMPKSGRILEQCTTYNYYKM